MARHDVPYKKGIDITAWVLQIVACLILLGASAYVLAVVNSNDYDEILGDYEGLFTASAGIQIGVTAATIVIDIVEIVLIARKRMPPALYLSFACIKTAIWGVIFILNIISLSIGSLILAGILLSTSLSQLIYGAKLVHRKRKGTLAGGHYTPAHNPAGNQEAGFGGNYQYGGTAPSYYAPPPMPTTAGYGDTHYKPPTGASPTPNAPAYGEDRAPNSYELGNRQHF